MPLTAEHHIHMCNYPHHRHKNAEESEVKSRQRLSRRGNRLTIIINIRCGYRRNSGLISPYLHEQQSTTLVQRPLPTLPEGSRLSLPTP